MSCRLLSKLRTFCHRIYEKLLMALSEGKKQEISWDSPFKWHLDYSMSWQSCALYIKFIYGPLRISCHTWKWAEMGEFLEKWTFCHVGTKCHSKVGWKICGQNVTDFGTKYYRESECHAVTNRPNLLGQNVTIWGGRTIRSLWDRMSQGQIVTAGGSLGRRIVWVEMSCGRFVGGRIVKAPYQQLLVMLYIQYIIIHWHFLSVSINYW